MNPLASDREFHYGEETTFYYIAVSIVCTEPSESCFLTVMKLRFEASESIMLKFCIGFGELFCGFKNHVFITEPRIFFK